MIGALKGILTHTVHHNPILVFAGPIGYSVYVSEKTRNELPLNTEILLYIHSHIRDDAFDLFGFLTSEELTLFELLLTVSGVGPKTALSVMDKGVPSVIHAIQVADVDFFTTIPRLGKKNAQKIIIELKQKIGGVQELSLAGDENSDTKELIEALLSMGFARSEILRSMQKLNTTDSPLEERLRAMLKILR